MGPAGGVDEDIGTIRLYDFQTGEIKSLLKGHKKEIIRLSFSPDSKLLASGGFDTSLLVWDVEQSKLVQRLNGHGSTIRALTFTHDGGRIVSGGDDNQLLLWSVSDGKLLKVMGQHEREIYGLAASIDGVIASGETSGDILLWDARSGAFLRKLGRECDSIGALDFSPDGKLLLATCGFRRQTDYYERVFEVATGNVITVYKGHDDRVRAGTFSPDGSLIVTGGGNDHAIRVWDPLTGNTKAVIKGRGMVVWGTAFSADGKKIAWGNTLSPEKPPRSHGPLGSAMSLPGDKRPSGVFEEVASESGWIRERFTNGAYSLKHAKGGQLGYDAILNIFDKEKAVASIEALPSMALFTAPTVQRRWRADHLGRRIGRFGISYNLSGQKTGEFIGHEGDVWGIAVSPNNRYLVSGAGDQTVRLWNLKTRELIVSMFVGTDGEWVIWTPQGYYASSPGADRI